MGRFGSGSRRGTMFWMASLSFSSPPASYRLDELGWLQFERVCSLLLAADTGLEDVRWTGHADDERVAVMDEPVISAGTGLCLDGPVTVIVVWVPESDSLEGRLGLLVERVAGLGSGRERVVVLTNLDDAACQAALERAAWAEDRTFVVWGARELGGEPRSPSGCSSGAAVRVGVAGSGAAAVAGRAGALFAGRRACSEAGEGVLADAGL